MPSNIPRADAQGDDKVMQFTPWQRSGHIVIIEEMSDTEAAWIAPPLTFDDAEDIAHFLNTRAPAPSGQAEPAVTTTKGETDERNARMAASDVGPVAPDSGVRDSDIRPIAPAAEAVGEPTGVLCTCGHSPANHTAYHPCHCTECECPSFRPDVSAAKEREVWAALKPLTINEAVNRLNSKSEPAELLDLSSAWRDAIGSRLGLCASDCLTAGAIIKALEAKLTELATLKAAAPAEPTRAGRYTLSSKPNQEDALWTVYCEGRYFVAIDGERETADMIVNALNAPDQAAEIAELKEGSRLAGIGFAWAKEENASQAAEIERLKPYADAIRERHNSYDPECRKAFGEDREPTPLEALDQLIDESAMLAKIESEHTIESLNETIESLQAQVAAGAGAVEAWEAVRKHRMWLDYWPIANEWQANPPDADGVNCDDPVDAVLSLAEKLAGKDQAAEIDKLRDDVIAVDETLTSEIERLNQLVCDFQAASMLDRNGDPDGITPAHIENEITSLRSKVAAGAGSLEAARSELSRDAIEKLIWRAAVTGDDYAKIGPVIHRWAAALAAKLKGEE